MVFFERFHSNSTAGSGNQHFFTMTEGDVRTGRIFYKITVGGTYRYSLLYSNIIDSTFSDGALSHKNLVCDSWRIHAARVGRAPFVPALWDMGAVTVSDEGEGKQTDVVVSDWTVLSFDGKAEKDVHPGEFFASDPVALSFAAGEYLCVELTFSGQKIPYHEESLLPLFVKENGVWTYSKRVPPVGMVGCDRPVKKRIAFLGDSITQGIGTTPNSYKHWNALLAEKLGTDYAFWNLGLGFGRANDAASDGAWLYKAKQNDVVLVCYGVNDILRGLDEEQIKADLAYIVRALTGQGVHVILQTVPPFDYAPDIVPKWERINQYIWAELAARVDQVFDTVPVLGREECASAAKYGGHPNEEGCAVWAEALYQEVKSLL